MTPLGTSENQDQVRQDPTIVEFLEPLAESLIDLERDRPRHRISQLFGDVLAHPTGEPLGRQPLQVVHLGPGVGDPAEHRAVPGRGRRDTLLSDGCTMAQGALDGQPDVLEVFGDMYAIGDLEEFAPIVDPTQWPDCPASGLFFRP